MPAVGWIDREVFKAAGFALLSEEVVLTEPQLQHIEENHPGDYELYKHCLSLVLAKPDYIVEANKPDTAVLLKHIEQGDERFQLILRLKVETDPEEYENSVITFWKIEGKRYRRYLRTKKVLYKRA